MLQNRVRNIALFFSDNVFRSNPEVLGSNPTGAKFSLARGDSQISFKRVATKGDLVYRLYCLPPAP